jgi:hypothetical protein
MRRKMQNTQSSLDELLPVGVLTRSKKTAFAKTKVW